MCWGEHRSWTYERAWEGRTPDQPPADLRASDADRHRLIDQLRTHTADGRLTLDEFEERVDQVLRATTHGDLRAVVQDLPALPALGRPTPPRRHRSRRPLPTPVLIAIIVLVGSLLVGSFAWWLIPLGFFVLGSRGHHHPPRPGRQREELDPAR